jgi:hypothetical protein
MATSFSSTLSSCTKTLSAPVVPSLPAEEEEVNRKFGGVVLDHALELLTAPGPDNEPDSYLDDVHKHALEILQHLVKVNTVNVTVTGEP